MEKIGQYLLSITAAAVICSVILSVQNKKSTNYTLIQMLCGIYMTVTLLSPLVRFRLPDLSGYMRGLQTESWAAAQMGTDAAEEMLEGIIKHRTETYILDKASSMGLDIHAEVILSDGELPTPCGVEIRGAASPYKRQQLQGWIREALGISEEAQIWS